MIHYGFLLRCQPVHLLSEPLLYDLTVSGDANADDFGKRSHEFCILKVIVPVQLYNSINGLVEGTKYIDDREAMSLLLGGNLIIIFRPYTKIVLFNGLVYPFRDCRFCYTDPAPNKIGKEALNMKSERDTVWCRSASHDSVSTIKVDLLW